jgi:hypothetical protein
MTCTLSALGIEDKPSPLRKQRVDCCIDIVTVVSSDLNQFTRRHLLAAGDNISIVSLEECHDDHN